MSDNKNVKTSVIILEDQQVPVSRKSATEYYRVVNTNLFDTLFGIMLVIGILGYMAAYIYYSMENNYLLKHNTGTAVRFHCPTTQNQKLEDLPCQGRAYHYDKTTGKKVCLI